MILDSEGDLSDAIFKNTWGYIWPIHSFLTSNICGTIAIIPIWASRWLQQWHPGSRLPWTLICMQIEAINLSTKTSARWLNQLKRLMQMKPLFTQWNTVLSPQRRYKASPQRYNRRIPLNYTGTFNPSCHMTENRRWAEASARISLLIFSGFTFYPVW